MSWQIVKDLKEKRAVAFAAAGAIRKLAQDEKRDLKPDEITKHDAFLTEVETHTSSIDREVRALGLNDAIQQNQSQQVRMGINGENSVGMPNKDFKRFSLLRAIRMTMKGQALDGVEAEVNLELTKRMGKSPQGFWMPTDLRTSGLAKRSLNAATSGVGSIETTTESTFIDVLRARTVTGKIGTTYLTGLQGKIALPRKTAAATAYWLGEGGSPTTSTQTLDQVVFTPKTLGAFTDITRQFAEQTSLDAEAFVIDDLGKTLGVSLDTAAFVGTGSGNQPQGIVGATGVTGIALGANGSNPTFANIINMETQVAALNADLGELAYVITPAARGYLKGVPKSSSAVAGGFIFEENEINGYPALATNILPSNGTKGSGTGLSTAVFGNFNDLVIAMWGGLDIMVDPYTGSSSGTVRIVALQDVDVELRHGQSFSTIVDMLTV